MKLTMNVFALVFLLSIIAVSTPQDPEHLVPVPRAKFCVTKGAIEQKSHSQLEVTVPEMRAVVDYLTEPVAEARFTYLGPSKESKPLASGELRRQFGLKLLAQNGCNLVYAMWRIEPKPGLEVLYKSNPGMSTSAECDAHGYHTVKPTRDLTVPRLKEGEKHTLRAEITGSKMQVTIDGKLVWEGLLADEALSFKGPSGVRSDNGRFQFEFLSSPAGKAENLPCHAAEGDE